MNKCNSCGLENPAGAAFCRCCGAQLYGSAMNDYDFRAVLPAEEISKQHRQRSISNFFFILAGVAFMLFLFFAVFFTNASLQDIATAEEYDVIMKTGYPNINISDSTVIISNQGNRWQYTCGYYHELKQLDTSSDSHISIDYNRIRLSDGRWFNTRFHYLFGSINTFGIYPDARIVFSIFSFILLLVFALLGFYKRKQSERERLDKIADYIELKHGAKGMRFFKRDGKIGLVDYKKHNILLPAQYDMLCWEEKGRILKAVKGNEVFLVDTTGYRLR